MHTFVACFSADIILSIHEHILSDFHGRNNGVIGNDGVVVVQRLCEMAKGRLTNVLHIYIHVYI